MRISLLFYRKLRKEFEAYGLTMNPYDPCVANMMTNDGNELSVIWHVDDLMASCKTDFELTKFSCYLARFFKPKLTMHSGTKHDYLGMDMEFNEDGMLDVSMITNLKNVIVDFPKLIHRRAATPASNHLFQVRDKRTQTPMQRTGIGLSPYSGAAVIYGHQSMAQHTNCGGVPDNAG
jgi:hypothetical protein